MAIYSGFSHWKWWFSIVTLVYQRVCDSFPNGNPLDIAESLVLAPRWSSPAAAAALKRCLSQSRRQPRDRWRGQPKRPLGQDLPVEDLENVWNLWGHLGKSSSLPSWKYCSASFGGYFLLQWIHCQCWFKMDLNAIFREDSRSQHLR